MIIENVQIKCKDCKRKIPKGNLEILPDPECFVPAFISGVLFNEAKNHHDNFREFDIGALQHREFIASKGKKIIGEFSVVSKATEMAFNIIDPEINNLFKRQSPSYGIERRI